MRIFLSLSIGLLCSFCLCGQDSATLARIKKMEYHHFINKVDTNFFLNKPIVRNDSFIVQTIAILDSSNWNGIYRSSFFDKRDSSEVGGEYFIYFEGALYYELFKPHHKPLRIYKKLCKRYGDEKVKQFEGYFYFRVFDF